jgi:hypothetical protein
MCPGVVHLLGVGQCPRLTWVFKNRRLKYIFQEAKASEGSAKPMRDVKKEVTAGFSWCPCWVELLSFLSLMSGPFLLTPQVPVGMDSPQGVDTWFLSAPSWLKS